MSSMQLDEFLRLYPIRSSNLAWFLGAGASASAKLPTANDLIWRFKKTLYCTSTKVDPRSCDDLGNDVVRARLQSYFDSAGRYPASDSPEEYASYFELTYPDPEDRRHFIETMLHGAKPAFGHHVLAALMVAKKVRLVWTTNFDRLVEDASASAFGSTSALTVSTIDSSSVALRALNQESWPLLGKLHGDFQSVALKNTTEELRTQDGALRAALVESCKRFGLVVAGYSGRDSSIMTALEDALSYSNPYPSGLFWISKAGSSVHARVQELVERARVVGVKAHHIETETFDELMGDIAHQFAEIPADTLAPLEKMRSRLSAVPLPASGVGWPVIRMNAVPVLDWPRECRKFDARIGGAKEVRDLLQAESAKIVAARSKLGVLAFGSDDEVRRVFATHRPESFGLHSIEVGRLWRETHELNLLRNALAQGLIEDAPLVMHGGRGFNEFRVDETQLASPRLAALRGVLQTLAGTIPRTSVRWAEAVVVRLEFRLGRLWMILDPVVWFGRTQSPDERYVCSDFVRERQARRYNRVADSVLDAWVKVLLPESGDSEIRAFTDKPGIEARFVLTRKTAFARRRS